MATYKGPVAGQKLMQQSINRTAANFKQVREGRRQRSVSNNNSRYLQQRFYTYTFETEEFSILSRLEALRDSTTGRGY
jgi:hypothetical protein